MFNKKNLDSKLIKKAEDMGFYTKCPEKALSFILDEMSRLSAVEKSSKDVASILDSCNNLYDSSTGNASLSEIFSLIDNAISKLNVKDNELNVDNNSENLFNKSYDEFISNFNENNNKTDWSKINNRHNEIQSFDFSSHKNESSDDYIAFSDSIKEWTLSELISKSMAVNAGDEKIKNVLKILFDKGYIK